MRIFQGHFRFFCWLLQNYVGTIQRQAHFKIANREAKEYIREHKKKIRWSQWTWRVLDASSMGRTELTPFFEVESHLFKVKYINAVSRIDVEGK